MEKNRSGILFIPDISGYSNFVNQTDNSMGAEIISSLLSKVLGANHLSLEVSEIEGDAVLFYRFGKAFAISKILQQYEEMLEAFEEEKKRLAITYPRVRSLSLKLIVHYGIIGTFSVRGFHKLYGKAVIEAHRLLKNNVHLDTYALITDAYINAAPPDDVVDDAGKLCEVDNDLGRICYSFFPYGLEAAA